jgi:hypothetical protein
MIDGLPLDVETPIALIVSDANMHGSLDSSTRSHP